MIGPNGAGKTTILRSIIKQLKPLGGVVVLDGKETEQISGKELSRKLSVVLTERVRPVSYTHLKQECIAYYATEISGRQQCALKL